MPFSRRSFLEASISASTLGALAQRTLLPVAQGATIEAYRANLLPSQKEEQRGSRANSFPSDSKKAFETIKVIGFKLNHQSP